MPSAETIERFFSRPLPEAIELDQPMTGKLFVIEGSDGSGRSTQIRLLSRWLESKGHAVKHMGIKRSNLAGEQLSLAQKSNVLTDTTMALFYATDFFDQLVTQIIPALAAGSIVLADRYIYTLMARARVRGADDAWLRNIYGPAVIPDAVFYFELEGELLFERYLNKSRSLDYWESGLDLGLADDMFDSFNKYQSLMHNEFQKMAKEYEFDMIDANRHVFGIQKELRKSIKPFLKS
jgi:dTMP kinase